MNKWKIEFIDPFAHLANLRFWNICQVFHSGNEYSRGVSSRNPYRAPPRV